jgi:hypothetical protein
MGYIYKITNDINDKVYVGKTCLPTIEQRFAEHLRDAKKPQLEKRPLYRAINKYGAEHFAISLIGEYPDEELNDYEIYWIGYYNGYTCGYNATKGGDGKMYLDHDAILARLKEYPYPIQVANEFNCSSDMVRQIATSNNIQVRNYGIDQNKQPVCMIDKNTNEVLKIFDSAVDGAKWCVDNGKASGIPDGTHIVAVCKNTNRKTAYGYKWKYVKQQ